MGLFSGIGKMFKKIGNAIGKGISYVGERMNNSVIENVGLNIQYHCDFGDFSYSSDSASADDVVDINFLFQKYYDDLENEIIKSGDDTKIIKQVASDLSECGDAIGNEFKSDRVGKLIIKFKDDLHDKFDGKLIDYIKPMFSLDNKECRSAMDEYDRDIRDKKLQDISKKAREVGFENFKRDCIEFKKECICEIVKILEEDVKSLQESHEKQRKVLDKLIKSKKDSDSIEIECARKYIEKEMFMIVKNFLDDEGFSILKEENN